MERKRINAHIAIIIANLLFGFNHPISRTLMPEIIDPIALTYYRLVGGTLLFWLAAIFVKYEKVSLRDTVLLFFAAFFSLTANQIPFFYGLSLTSPIDASIVVSTLPIASMLLAALILKEPITLKKAFGVVIGATGALFLVLSDNVAKIGAGNLSGNIFVLMAVISFALYLTLFNNLIRRYSPFTVMRWMFLFSAIQSYPFCHAAVEAVNPLIFNWSVVLRISYVIIFATFLSYIFLAAAQRTLLPTTLSMYNYSQPIIASLATVAMGLGVFGYHQLLAIVLVFLGVYIVTQSKTREQIEVAKKQKSVENSL